jgi:hypothetical protein
MNLQEHIRKVLKEESKKQSLLKTIQENGLYDFMEMTGISLPEVYERVGELSRNILEQYLIDCIMEEGYETSYDSRKKLIVTTPIKHNVYADYISTEGKTLWVEISDYNDDDNDYDYNDDDNDNDEPSDVYTTSADNLSDGNIFDIVNDITERKLRDLK